MTDPVRLDTDRLVLRPFLLSDFDAFAAIAADPETTRFIGGVRDRVEAWRWMAATMGHWWLRGFGVWAVEERQSGQLIGRVGLQQPEGWPEVEVAWLIARSHWGRGYATEAARAAIAYGFEQLHLDHIISLISQENVASVRVAEKAGEALEGPIQFLGMEVSCYGIHRA